MVDNENEVKEQNFLFSPPQEGDSPLLAGQEPEQPIVQEQPVPDAPEQKDLITVGKNKYAVGLFWQPLQDVDDPIPEIRETMEADAGSDLYCIHYGRAPQYGIGKKSKGHAEGISVGGISVLDALSDKSSFVAVFKVPEGWWFVAVRNDLILPEEDVLYRDEAQAKDAFFSMMAVPDWGYKIAPAEWHIDGTEEMDLAELLKNAFQVRLVSLSAARGTKILLAIAALILVVVGVIVYFIFMLYDRAATQPMKIEPVQPQAAIQTVEPTREEEKPWEKLVEVNPFLNRCWSYAYQLKSMTVPGWALNQIVCTPQGITTGWRMSWPRGGRIAWLQSAYEEYKFKDIELNINETGDSATASIKYNDLPIIASTPTLSLARIRRELTDISQALSMRIAMQPQEVTIGGPTPQQQAAAQPGQQLPQGKTYKFLSFSFSSAMDPPAWESFFDKFSALEIVRIQYNPRSESALTENWSYEGRIYEK